MSEPAVDKERIVRPITKAEALRHPSFIDGYMSIAKGLPFNRHVSRTADEEWHYGRGRQVASLSKQRFGYMPSLWCDGGGASVINPKVIDVAGSMGVYF